MTEPLRIQYLDEASGDSFLVVGDTSYWNTLRMKDYEFVETADKVIIFRSM